MITSEEIAAKEQDRLERSIRRRSLATNSIVYDRSSSNKGRQSIGDNLVRNMETKEANRITSVPPSIPTSNSFSSNSHSMKKSTISSTSPSVPVSKTISVQELIKQKEMDLAQKEKLKENKLPQRFRRASLAIGTKSSSTSTFSTSTRSSSSSSSSLDNAISSQKPITDVICRSQSFFNPPNEGNKERSERFLETKPSSFPRSFSCSTVSNNSISNGNDRVDTGVNTAIKSNDSDSKNMISPQLVSPSSGRERDSAGISTPPSSYSKRAVDSPQKSSVVKDLEGILNNLQETVKQQQNRVGSGLRRMSTISPVTNDRLTNDTSRDFEEIFSVLNEIGTERKDSEKIDVTTKVPTSSSITSGTILETREISSSNDSSSSKMIQEISTPDTLERTPHDKIINKEDTSMMPVANAAQRAQWMKLVQDIDKEVLPDVEAFLEEQLGTRIRLKISWDTFELYRLESLETIRDLILPMIVKVFSDQCGSNEQLKQLLRDLVKEIRLVNSPSLKEKHLRWNETVVLCECDFCNGETGCPQDYDWNMLFEELKTIKIQKESLELAKKQQQEQQQQMNLLSKDSSSFTTRQSVSRTRSMPLRKEDIMKMEESIKQMDDLRLRESNVQTSDPHQKTEFFLDEIMSRLERGTSLSPSQQEQKVHRLASFQSSSSSISKAPTLASFPSLYSTQLQQDSGENTAFESLVRSLVEKSKPLVNCLLPENVYIAHFPSESFRDHVNDLVRLMAMNSSDSILDTDVRNRYGELMKAFVKAAHNFLRVVSIGSVTMESFQEEAQKVRDALGQFLKFIRASKEIMKTPPISRRLSYAAQAKSPSDRNVETKNQYSSKESSASSSFSSFSSPSKIQEPTSSLRQAVATVIGEILAQLKMSDSDITILTQKLAELVAIVRKGLTTSWLQYTNNRLQIEENLRSLLRLGIQLNDSKGDISVRQEMAREMKALLQQL